MKLQSLTVIFAIIVIPMTLILSAYIGVQMDTQNLQQSYDTKLLDATHDAIVAFELNSLDNAYSASTESLRRDVQASINTFFNALALNLGTPAASTSHILQYIPAIVFTLNDGYYIYSPMEKEYLDEAGNIKTRYEHTLKPYIHYSMRYKTDDANDLVVNYSLDNYITVYGYLRGNYISRSGYLISGTVANNGRVYNNISITDTSAQTYYKNAKIFTDWVRSNISSIVVPKNAIDNNGNRYTEFSNNNIEVLYIDDDNNPESELSDFVGHKREVMRLSIQSNLNNAIYVYDNHSTTSTSFRMPVLTEDDWDKILSNVNMITFMQGIPAGTKIYNDYAIVTSTKNKQYVNEDLLYFTAIGDNYYHKINCPEIENKVGVVGHKTIDFERIKDEDGNYTYKDEYKNLYACYDCIIRKKTYDMNLNDRLLSALYTALGKEKYNFTKLFVSD